jgi:hypothetical protein
MFSTGDDPPPFLSVFTQVGKGMQVMSLVQAAQLRRFSVCGHSAVLRSER